MRILIVAVLVSLIAWSCTKKQTNQSHCWSCIQNDSLVSNYAALSNSHYKKLWSFHCNMNEGQAAFFVKTNTYTDTLSLMHDTLLQEYWVMSCTRNDY